MSEYTEKYWDVEAQGYCDLLSVYYSHDTDLNIESCLINKLEQNHLDVSNTGVLSLMTLQGLHSNEIRS